ncbi:MAG: DUF1598 domain-containing protein [Planctomycetota bacterium]
MNNFAQPIATTVQLPTFGVSFDADGVLELKTFTDPTGQLRADQRAALAARIQEQLGARARHRKVSLIRLEAALNQRIREGKAPDESMLVLAGLTRIESAFCFPDENDIVVSGPAEPWVNDFGGVPRGIHSGRPVLRLEDLVVALRAYRHNDDRAFVGCTISPRAEGLACFRQFQRRIPKAVSMNQREQLRRAVASGSIEALGPADVAVLGISPQTHFARVMIEADYRMKRMAIGTEKPPVEITSYAEALRTVSQGTLERWWLTPAYDGVLRTPDAMAMRLSGQGVGLRTEMKQVSERGELIDGGKPNRAATTFANSFTKQYEALSKHATIYAQLRQLCDLLIIAAFMKRHGWFEETGWQADLFGDESTYSIESYSMPKQASPAVHSFWKQNRMFVPVGGGVSIEAGKAIDQATLDSKIERPNLPLNAKHWWWD